MKAIKNLIMSNGNEQIQVNKTDVQRNVSLFEANETANNMPQTQNKYNLSLVYTIILLSSLLLIFIFISVYLLIKFMKKPKKKKKKVITHQ